MIKIVRPIFFLITFLTVGVSAHSQTALSGRVVGIVDGKTFVIETGNGRITGAIQYVDVPEPEQPLSRIVREHFRGLVIGKTVTFIPNGFASTALVGKLYLNGLDMGQQLVRDGAAWHVPPDRSGQNAEESRIYDSHQTMAKVEKRGIWSIENMTPAWEFRSRKDKDTSFIQTALNGVASDETRNYKYSKNNADMWVEVGGDAFAQQNAVGQMFWGYDADKKIRNTSTPSIAQVLVTGKRPLEVELRVIYFQGEIKPKSPNTAFVLGILATSTEQNFAGDNSVTFDVDGTEIIVGSGQRFWRGNSLSVQELSQYRISRSDLLKIANAKKRTVHVGKYAGPVGRELSESLLRLFEVVG